MNLNYIYNSPSKIIKDISSILDFTSIELIFLIIFILLFILILLYILPILYSMKEELLRKIDKKKKKLMLQKIILQKEIEDDILKTIKNK